MNGTWRSVSLQASSTRGENSAVAMSDPDIEPARGSPMPRPSQAGPEVIWEGSVMCSARWMRSPGRSTV